MQRGQVDFRARSPPAALRVPPIGGRPTGISSAELFLASAFVPPETRFPFSGKEMVFRRDKRAAWGRIS